MSLRRYAAAVVGLAVAFPAFADPVPVADFSKHLQYRSVKISPDGKHLATDSMIDGKRHLTLIDLDNRKAVNIRPRGDDELYRFWWTGPNRLIYKLAQVTGGLELPRDTGELFGVNADGSANDMIFGQRLGGGEGGTHIKKTVGELAFAEVIDTLRDDDEHILIWTQPFDGGPDGTMPEVFRFDTKDGSKKLLFQAPLRNAQFITDNAGVVRFAFAPGSDDTLLRVMYRANDDAKWEEVYKAKDSTANAQPLAFDRTNQVSYWICDVEGAAQGLCTWSDKERTLKPVWNSKEVGVDKLILSFDEQDVVAVESMPGRAALNPLQKDSDKIKTLVELMKQFPGEHVSMNSCDKEGNRCVVEVSSDINPGEYFVLDRKEKKLTPVLKVASWLDPEKMASVEPVTLKARDGLPLHGYLTKPLGKESEKNLPLVVYVHGGPFGPRDRWEFDDTVQLLASRGYAVLQVNFRGSGGYGSAFEVAGYREWGGKMQDDVTDATKWVIAQGVADAKRICIYGGSYGGYAALQGTVREPDLYRCAIGDAGVYDLAMMYTRGDVQQTLYGESYLKRVLGEDKAMLAQRSPIAQIAQIKAKLMLIAGGQDKRVPPVQAQNLHMALEKRSVAHEWLYQRTEGHGFYDEKNLEDMYTKVLAFLEANIGAGAK